jgi:hypothetical protein
MVRRTLNVLAVLVVLSCAALAQITGGSGVTTFGAITNGHCASFLNSTTIEDSGGACGGAGSSPGGSAGQLQYNNTVFGGISQWTTNGTTTLTGSSTSVFNVSAASAANVELPAGIAGTGITYSSGVLSLTNSAITIGGTSVSLGGSTSSFPSPGAIGGTTPASGAFTTLSASSTVSGSGFSTYLASPPAIGGSSAAAGTFTTLTGTAVTASTSLTINGGTAQTGTQGTDTKLLTAGTISGTSVSLCTDANGGATTSSCPTGGPPLGTSAQIPIMNSGATAYAPQTLSGDSTLTNSGVMENTGLLSNVLPSLAVGYLNWTGSAWSLNTPSGLLPTATAVGQIPYATGAGTTYNAQYPPTIDVRNYCASFTTCNSTDFGATLNSALVAAGASTGGAVATVDLCGLVATGPYTVYASTNPFAGLSTGLRAQLRMNCNGLTIIHSVGWWTPQGATQFEGNSPGASASAGETIVFEPCVTSGGCGPSGNPTLIPVFNNCIGTSSCVPAYGNAIVAGPPAAAPTTYSTGTATFPTLASHSTTVTTSGATLTQQMVGGNIYAGCTGWGGTGTCSSGSSSNSCVGRIKSISGTTITLDGYWIGVASGPSGTQCLDAQVGNAEHYVIQESNAVATVCVSCLGSTSAISSWDLNAFAHQMFGLKIDLEDLGNSIGIYNPVCQETCSFNNITVAESEAHQTCAAPTTGFAGCPNNSGPTAIAGFDHDYSFAGQSTAGATHYDMVSPKVNIASSVAASGTFYGIVEECWNQTQSKGTDGANIGILSTLPGYTLNGTTYRFAAQVYIDGCQSGETHINHAEWGDKAVWLGANNPTFGQIITVRTSNFETGSTKSNVYFDAQAGTCNEVLVSESQAATNVLINDTVNSVTVNNSGSNKVQMPYIQPCPLNSYFNGTSFNTGSITAPAGSAAGTVNFASEAHTLPAVAGLTASKPATCTVGEVYFATDATAGQNWYFCTSTNTWTQQLNSGAAGMNQSASNSSAVAVNSSWIPGSDNVIDLGSASLRWRNEYVGGSLIWTNGSGTVETGLCQGANGQLDVSLGGTCGATGNLFAAGFASGSASVPGTGEISLPATAAPSSPASGTLLWFDSTDLRLHEIGNAGSIGTTVVANAGTSHEWFSALSTAGVLTATRPAISDLTATFTSPLTLSTNTLSISGVTSEQGNGAKLQLSTGTATSTAVVVFDANGNTITSDLRETSNVLNNGTATQLWTITGGADASANSALGGLTLRGANETGAGGSSSTGGNLLLQGGSNAATNASSTAGSILIVPGASTGATQGLQGLVGIAYQFIKAATSTQWNLACISSTTAMTTKNCGASPQNWLGVFEAVNSNTDVVVIPPSEIPINASGAVTVGDTVCAGGTAGEVTDSGGTSTCTNSQGVTVGIVVAVSGTYPIGDGTTQALSTTLPLIAMNTADSQGSGSGGSPALSSVTGSTTQATGTESAAGDNYGFAGIETATKTYPFFFTNASSSNNSSGALLVATTGSGTSQVPLVVAEDGSGTNAGDLIDAYVGATNTNGALSGGSLLFSVGVSGNITSGKQNSTAGSLTVDGSSAAGGSITINGDSASPGSSVLSVSTAGTTLNLGSTNATVTTSGAAVFASTLEADSINYLTSLTSGGVLYGSSSSQVASSAALAVNAIVQGGGAGAAPTTGNGDFTIDSTAHTLKSGASGLVDLSAETGAPSLKLPQAVGGTSLAGTSTANLSTPITITNANSSNNNTSFALGVSASGSSTGQTVMNLNQATTGGDILDWGTGGSYSAGSAFRPNDLRQHP